MAKPGPKPTPTHLQVLRGHWDRRTMMPEPAAEQGPCPPPDDLDDASREVWEQLRPELETMGLLAPRYSYLFRVLCETVVVNRQAGDLLMRSGPMISEGTADGKRRPVVNPTLRAYRQTTRQLMDLSAEFGLTPASVTALARDAGHARNPETDRGDPRRLLSR